MPAYEHLKCFCSDRLLNVACSITGAENRVDIGLEKHSRNMSFANLILSGSFMSSNFCFAILLFEKAFTCSSHAHGRVLVVAG